jgi:hypothetical protein
MFMSLHSYSSNLFSLKDNFSKIEKSLSLSRNEKRVPLNPIKPVRNDAAASDKFIGGAALPAKSLFLQCS